MIRDVATALAAKVRGGSNFGFGREAEMVSTQPEYRFCAHCRRFSGFHPDSLRATGGGRAKIPDGTKIKSFGLFP
jgi:hypothetical protein